MTARAGYTCGTLQLVNMQLLYAPKWNLTCKNSNPVTWLYKAATALAVCASASSPYRATMQCYIVWGVFSCS